MSALSNLIPVFAAYLKEGNNVRYLENNWTVTKINEVVPLNCNFREITLEEIEFQGEPTILVERFHDLDVISLYSSGDSDED
jgi:hypothetical protein